MPDLGKGIRGKCRTRAGEIKMKEPGATHKEFREFRENSIKTDWYSKDGFLFPVKIDLYEES